MLKSDVLAKLIQFKDRPIEIGLSDEGAMMHANIDGHWVFVDGDNLVEVKVNAGDGTYGFSSATQQYSPFSIMTTPFEYVMYVKSYINNEPGDINDKVSSLLPIGTSKSIDDILKEIESNPVRKALSPRGNLNVKDVAPGGSYGAFKGSAISTEIGGIPAYMKEALLNNTKTEDDKD